jgi:hypothetical protein
MPDSQPHPTLADVVSRLDTLIAAVQSLDLAAIARIAAAVRVAEQKAIEQAERAKAVKAAGGSLTHRMLRIIQDSGERGIVTSVLQARTNAKDSDHREAIAQLLSSGEVGSRYGKRGGQYLVYSPPSPQVTPA